MGRSSTGLTSFCLSQIATRVRLWSPKVESNPDIQSNQHVTPACNRESDDSRKDERGAPVVYVGRRVMILIDSSVEAKFALQWALSHAVESSDTLVLLDVPKPSKQGSSRALPSGSNRSKADHRRRSKKTKDFSSNHGAKEKILHLEVADDVGKQKEGWGSRRILCAACNMHGFCS